MEEKCYDYPFLDFEGLTEAMNDYGYTFNDLKVQIEDEFDYWKLDYEREQERKKQNAGIKDARQTLTEAMTHYLKSICPDAKITEVDQKQINEIFDEFEESFANMKNLFGDSKSEHHCCGSCVKKPEEKKKDTRITKDEAFTEFIRRLI